MEEEQDDSSVGSQGCDMWVASMGCLLGEQAATRSERVGCLDRVVHRGRVY